MRTIVLGRNAGRRTAALGLIAASLALWSLHASAAPQGQQADFTVKARHAILMEAATGALLFQQNANEASPPASMSKLMTLSVLFKAMKEGKIKPDDEFVMSVRAWRTGGAPSGTSAMFVPVNTKARVSELIQGIIVQSGNDAAICVAEAMAGSEDKFAKLMQEEAGRLGLKHSSFMNASGLHHPGHLMSVRDLAVVARHLINEYPEHYPIFAQREFLYRKHKFYNRNPLLSLEIGVDGMKTGFIKESGHGIVASAKQGERRLIAVVNGAATADERRDEARKLLEWGFKNFTEFKLYDAGEIVGQARVWGGRQFYVPLTGNGDVTVILPRSPASHRLRGDIVYNSPLKPPIRRGDLVARLRVTSATNTVNEIPLHAAEDVDAGGVMRRGLDSLAHLAFGWIR